MLLRLEVPFWNINVSISNLTHLLRNFCQSSSPPSFSPFSFFPDKTLPTFGLRSPPNSRLSPSLNSLLSRGRNSRFSPSLNSLGLRSPLNSRLSLPNSRLSPLNRGRNSRLSPGLNSFLSPEAGRNFFALLAQLLAFGTEFLVLSVEDFVLAEFTFQCTVE
mgnify:CR=1 FL=1